jgi:hypothetical protein
MLVSPSVSLIPSLVPCPAANGATIMLAEGIKPIFDSEE